MTTRTHMMAVYEQAPPEILNGSIHSAEDIHEYMKGKLENLTVEQFWTLILDAKNRVIGEVMVSQGSLSSSIVHPREVFKPAIMLSGAHIICVHNHPSGDPAPSYEDRAITTQLVEAGQVLGIPVLDHIIIAREGFTSLAEEGAL